MKQRCNRTACKRLGALLLALALTVCLLPVCLETQAEAVSLSSSDKSAVEDFLSYFWWSGREYNCLDAARVSEGWSMSPNLLTSLLMNGYPVRYSLYPGEGVYQQWSGRDPQGRWSSYTRVRCEDAHWILRNIFHCDETSIATMRKDLASSQYFYEQNGYYYAFLGGVGGGEYTRNLQARDYGQGLYLFSFYFEDSISGDKSGTRYAVMDKATIDGKSYWTLYWFGSSRPSQSGFLDVDDDAYYASAVEWAVDEGITAGVSKVAFAPDGK